MGFLFTLFTSWAGQEFNWGQCLYVAWILQRDYGSFLATKSTGIEKGTKKKSWPAQSSCFWEKFTVLLKKLQQTSKCLYIFNLPRQLWQWGDLQKKIIKETNVAALTAANHWSALLREREGKRKKRKNKKNDQPSCQRTNPLSVPIKSLSRPFRIFQRSGKYLICKGWEETK